MIVVLSSFELVNIAYYILLPWSKLSTNNAVAVAAATSLLGRPAGIVITLLVVISCAGSITSNVFAVGRLTMAASQRHYLPAIFSKRGLPTRKQTEASEDETSTFDAPVYVKLVHRLLAMLTRYVVMRTCWPSSSALFTS
jgi:L-type amino acid transporter 9